MLNRQLSTYPFFFKNAKNIWHVWFDRAIWYKSTECKCSMLTIFEAWQLHGKIRRAEWNQQIGLWLAVEQIWKKLKLHTGQIISACLLLWFIFRTSIESNINKLIQLGGKTPLYDGGENPVYKWRSSSDAVSSLFYPSLSKDGKHFLGPSIKLWNVFSKTFEQWSLNWGCFFSNYIISTIA